MTDKDTIHFELTAGRWHYDVTAGDVQPRYQSGGLAAIEKLASSHILRTNLLCGIWFAGIFYHPLKGEMLKVCKTRKEVAGVVRGLGMAHDGWEYVCRLRIELKLLRENMNDTP